MGQVRVTVVMLIAAVAIGAPAAGAGSVSAAGPGWAEVSSRTLNIFSPDTSAIYFVSGYATGGGVRTVIAGRAPRARYWAIAIYRGTSGAISSVHDSQIPLTGGRRYRVVIAGSCRGVQGSCLATGTTSSGLFVYRLYVPVDLSRSGTGGVGLPLVTYLARSGQRVSFVRAAPGSSVAAELNALRAGLGKPPPELTRSYPPPGAVVSPDNSPPPRAHRGSGRGPFANPDNIYLQMHYSLRRGNLVMVAAAPTYRRQSSHPANSLDRAGIEQVRYWSLCIVLRDKVTLDCLRDEQVQMRPGSDVFDVIVAPRCPVAGYANCLRGGPLPLEDRVTYRNLLVSRAFQASAFAGRYALRGRYVSRTG